MVDIASGSGRLAEAWSGWMLQMGWQVALLVAVVWVLTLLMRRSNAALRFALWLLVFVKLVIPPGLSAPWSVGAVARDAWPAAARWAANGPRFEAPAPPSSYSQTSLGLSETSESSAGGEEGRLAEELAGVETIKPRSFTASQVTSQQDFLRRHFGVAQVLAMVWGGVAAGLLALMVAQWRWYGWRLLRNAEAAPEEVMAWGRTQSARLGLRKPVEIRMSPRLRVPCVVGFRKAVVLLPREVIQHLSPGQQADLIAHEIAHIKRGDLLTGWMASVLVCLYWFHPAVWLANLYLRREREMACDDKVLHATRREGTEYASTMVRVAEGFDGGVPVGAGFLGLFEIADNLLQRIRSASDGTRSRRAGWRSVLTVAFVALALIPMGARTSSWAQSTSAVSAIDREIAQCYPKAGSEVKNFMRMTAERFGPEGLWLPQDTFVGLSPQEREAKVKQVLQAIEGGVAYKELAEAGALHDARLVPALSKVALDMKEGGQDNRARWMAVVALGRIGDKTAVSVLVPLVDHYNQNTRMWARASLARITGENFDADKSAWVKWANAAGPDTAITPDELNRRSIQSEERMKTVLTAEAMQGQAEPLQEAFKDAFLPEAEKEIGQHYSSAAPEVKEYIKWTAVKFGRAKMWLPEGAFDSMTPEQREEKVKYLADLMNGEYGRHLCASLAEAGVINDKRLLPGLMKMADYHREDKDYDCRPKWIAVASLGRQDDPSAAPLLVDLVDHGNKNTKMWAQASMSRLTGQNFGTDKKAWAEWWNTNGKEPKIDVSQLKPWTPPAQKTAAAPSEPGGTKQPPEGRPGDLGVVGFLGVEVKDAAEWREKAGLTTPGGLYVYRVVSNGPAAKAGVQEGDIICTLDGKAVTTVEEFVKSVRGLGAGVKAKLGLWRDRQMTSQKVVIAAAYPVPGNESQRAVRPPEIVSTEPKMGASEVDPALTALRITFDQDMAPGFSWTGGPPLFPETTGKPRWVNARTCEMPVKLESGRVYRLGINSKSHQNFRSAAGAPVRPEVLAFATKGASAEDVKSLDPPHMVTMVPANGASGVSPSVDKLVVTFDVPMGGGFSWTGGGENYPETAGAPSWSDDKKTCTLPVKLKPDWKYRLGLNSPSHVNFQSSGGIPLQPVEWTFSTGK